MDLHPHLHLLVPSTTSGVDLEVRLYMSRQLLDKIPKSWTSINGLSSSSASNPVPASLVDQDTLDILKHIDRLVIASHPWGRFGGNMLFPYVSTLRKANVRVIALHLVSAALVPDVETSTKLREGEAVVPVSRTAVLCYNVRGIGKSGGRQAWLGAGEHDYGAIERWGVDVTGVKDVWRFVCSLTTYYLLV